MSAAVETWDEAGSSTLTDLAREIAVLRAASDEALLARLVAEGKVVRAATHASAERKFEALANPPKINLAIRPKKRKGKR